MEHIDLQSQIHKEKIYSVYNNNYILYYTSNTIYIDLKNNFVNHSCILPFTRLTLSLTGTLKKKIAHT
jgi:hypothetical protein